MNAKRAKFATITTSIGVKSEDIVPVLIHDPNGTDEPQYAYAAFATADEAEAAVASLNDQQHEALTNAHEVIIDENGHAVTIQELVENSSVEEVTTVEESDGTHTILHIVPSSHHHHHQLSEDGEVVEIDNEQHHMHHEMHEEYEDADASQSSGGEATGSRTKTFYCPNCGNCYSAAGSLKLHMRACLRQRQEVPPEDRKCNICCKVFNSVNYLKEHMLRHTGEGPKRCTRCYRKFIDEDKYKAHLEMHKQQEKLDAEAEALSAQHGGKKVVVKEFTCSFCSQLFTVVFEVGQVKRRYACDTCREKYSNAEMLKKHKRELEDKREFSCQRCGRRFVFEGFLQRHLPTCDGVIKRRRDMK